MQRSRRALLRRRALTKSIGGRYRLYSLSLSLVFILWGLIFLVSLWTSCGGNGHEGSDIYGNLMCGVKDTALGEIVIRTIKNSCPKNETGFDIVVTAAGDEPVSSSSSLTTSPVEPDPDPAGPLSLDAFRAKVSNPKIKSPFHMGRRTEHGGADYNYASASKGAKVLAFNRETKGALNVLGKDKDKYLRNPCSADDKFVTIELSEETLVSVIAAGNVEHHSSNPRDFRVTGSLVYPTDAWFGLGNFTAANVKQIQRFALPEPKWVRYLRLDLLTHYGSEFYCTLSSFEVYGVDAIEHVLEDLLVSPGEPDCPAGDAPDPVRHTSVRPPTDTVLKVVMQKVRVLDHDLAMLGRYLDHLSSMHHELLDRSSRSSHQRDLVLDKVRSGIRSLLESRDAVAKEVNDLVSWKGSVSNLLDALADRNEFLRSEVEEVRESQVHMENKGIFVFLISLVFGFVALTRLMLGKVENGGEDPQRFCWLLCSPWGFLLWSCVFTIFILSF